MKIIIDGRMQVESGIGRYIRNLVSSLEKIDRQNEYFILHLQKNYDVIRYGNKNFHKVLAGFKWYSLEEQLRLPGILNDIKADLVHFPHFNIPAFYQGKFVVTIHDLIHQHFASREATTLNPLLYQIKRMGYRWVFGQSVKRSFKILTPSSFVKKQLVDEWNVSKEKITVTQEGVDESILKLSEAITDKDFIKVNKKFGIKRPYLFYIGNAQPHKNLQTLINAFFQLKKIYTQLSLVLAGPQHLFWQKLKNSVNTRDVIFTGFLPEEDLVISYKNALCFILPSLEEGFGIPVLEAMACSCPVVCSNRGSLPEVGGDAVLYFDPQNQEEIVEKIKIILENNELREELIKKGEKRYQLFSWQKMAEQTLQTYQINNE